MVAFVSGATLLAGCGSSSSGGGGSTGTTGGTGSNNSTQTPAAELTSAFSALGKASTLTTSIKLGATASDLQALASSQGSTLTSTEASAIAGAEISVEVSAPSGKTLSDLSTGGTTGSAVDFSISDNGTKFISVRSVNKVLYLQADVKDLLTTIGQGATYQALAGQTAGAPSYIQALLSGKWVSLQEAGLSALAGGAASSSGASPNPQQVQAVVAALKKVLTDDVTVTRTSSGSTDQLALSANSRTVATDLFTAIQAAVPSAGAALGQADPTNVPSKNVALGAAVTGGALSQLSIDIGQFDPKGKTHLPIDVDFTQGGSAITAPPGAVAVNLQQLGQLLGSFAGGLGGTG